MVTWSVWRRSCSGTVGQVPAAAAAAAAAVVLVVVVVVVVVAQLRDRKAPSL